MQRMPTPAPPPREVQIPAGHGPFDALAQGQDWRGKLERLDAALLQCEQCELPITHYFARGVYAREGFIPAGAVVSGRIHKFSQINVLLSGEISVLTEAGIERLSAGAVIESPPGTKRAAYAHTDVRWLMISGTHTTDTEALVDELTVKTYPEYEAYCALISQDEQPCLSSLAEPSAPLLAPQ